MGKEQARMAPDSLGEGTKSAATTKNPHTISIPQWTAADVEAAITGVPKPYERDICSFEGVKPLGTITTYRGKPAVIFSEEEEAELLVPFKFTLIAEFADGFPRRDVLEHQLHDLGFKGPYFVSFFADFIYCLIRLSNEEDFNKMWTRRKEWIFDGCKLGVRKFHADFTPSTEKCSVDRLKTKPHDHNGVVKLVRWIKPRFGWFKLNTDGASKGNPGRAGAGGLVRDHQGAVQFAFSYFLGRRMDFIFAEMCAVYKGLVLCIERGIHHVWIEVDALDVIKLLCFYADLSTKKQLEHLKRKTKTLMDQLAVKITHIYREGNRAAHYLANLACETGQSKVFGSDDEISEELLEMIRLDNKNVSYVRQTKCW